MYFGLDIIVGILWFLSAAVDYSEFLYVWQLKEYRLDRMRDFFTTKDGKHFFENYRIMVRPVIAIILYGLLHDAAITLTYVLISLFSVDLLWNMGMALRGKVRHPILTKKAFLIAASCFLFEVLLFVGIVHVPSLFLLVLFRFFILTLVVFCFGYPTAWLKRWYIQQATKKLATYTHVKVIGITGSYGKTSVKNFLSHILEQQYRVARTPKNINTEIGVARYILSTNFTDIDIFVVEMGAYTMGEIKLICDMVHPSVGILTAINEQHLSLFGHIRNTQKAKYELLRSLPEGGLAIVNSDNVYCRELLHELSTSVETYGYDEEWKPTCLIADIKTNEGCLCVTYTIHDDEWTLTMPISGDHNAQNIAACILAARKIGMKKEDIITAAKTLTMPDGTLNIFQYGSATIIDDTYNANPDGFKSALYVLSRFPSRRRRIVITRGMLELGERSDDLHERVGGEISYTADELVIIRPDHKEALIRGMGKNYRTEVRCIYDAKELREYVMKLKETDAVVLMENRLLPLVYNEIIRHRDVS